MSLHTVGFLADLGRTSLGIVLSPYDVPSGGSVTPTNFRWERVRMGFVSAYVYQRGTEATLIDTGTPRNEENISRVVAAMGLGWHSIGHVIVTHHHNDHQGSLVGVLDLATDATPYAGKLDIPSITSTRPVVPVGDGDTVMGLRIVDTPGHTPGHISVLDPGRVLFAGDALIGEAGFPAGPDPDFTEDMEVAWRSVAKLAGLPYEVAVFGHGEPAAYGASDAVASLVKSREK